MAETITCPACQRSLQVPESYFGQAVQCPECRHQFEAQPHLGKVEAHAPAALRPRAPLEEEAPRRRRDFDDEDDDDPDFRPLRRQLTPHRGGMILAMGLLALVLFPYVTIVCGPMAWVMGNSDLAEIRAERMDPSGEGLVQAGRVLGIIATLLFALGVGLGCLMFGLLVLAGAG
jgi:hypothetical protein